jgi:hypothetical protein
MKNKNQHTKTLKTDEEKAKILSELSQIDESMTISKDDFSKIKSEFTDVLSRLLNDFAKEIEIQIKENLTRLSQDIQKDTVNNINQAFKENLDKVVEKSSDKASNHLLKHIAGYIGIVLAFVAGVVMTFMSLHREIMDYKLKHEIQQLKNTTHEISVLKNNLP